MSSERLKLGDKVQYTSTLYRADVDLTPGAFNSDWERRWVSQPLSGDPGNGIIVGARTLADGKVEYAYGDHTSSFIKKRTFQAYMVVSELRRKPFFVLPEDVTLVKEDEGEAVRQAIQKEREALLESIAETPPAKGFTYSIGDTLEVGVRLKVLLGDDWQVLVDKIKAKALNR